MTPSVTTSTTSKGQVTIPVEIRRRLGIRPGDRLRIALVGKKIEIEREPLSFEEAFQSVPALREPKSWKEIRQAVAEERAEAYERKWSEKKA